MRIGFLVSTCVYPSHISHFMGNLKCHAVPCPPKRFKRFDWSAPPQAPPARRCVTTGSTGCPAAGRPAWPPGPRPDAPPWRRWLSRWSFHWSAAKTTVRRRPRAPGCVCLCVFCLFVCLHFLCTGTAAYFKCCSSNRSTKVQS